MRLEAVIVCLNYGDFLAETLPLNLNHFDDMIVVTGHDDKETQRVCDRWSVEYFTTACFTDYGDPFNKGKAINLGISNLKKNGWLLHLDADIVLPHRYRDMLRRTQLKEDCIYGADRVNVYGWNAWQKLKMRIHGIDPHKATPHYQDNWFLDPDFIHEWNQPKPEGLRIGARVIHKEQGWVPIGYHQLWHGSKSMRRYNFALGAASGADVFFPCQWPREKRILLPEVVCYHLDSDKEHFKGTNWQGRKSPRFEPSKKKLGDHLTGGHHGHHGHHPYDGGI